jgi:hypothetical protein
MPFILTWKLSAVRSAAERSIQTAGTFDFGGPTPLLAEKCQIPPTVAVATLGEISVYGRVGMTGFEPATF